MQYTVKVIANQQELTRTININDGATDAGSLVDHHGIAISLRVKGSKLEGKVKEETILLRQDVYQDGVLSGEATLTGKRKKQKVGFKLADNPTLQPLYEAYQAAKQQIGVVREELLAPYKPQPVIIPDGMIRVTFTRSAADGWIQYYKDAAGRELESPKLAGYNGHVGWMTPEDHAAAIAAADKAAEDAKPKGHWEINPAYANLSAAELQQREREYDRIHNEGGDGYNPYRDQREVWIKD